MWWKQVLSYSDVEARENKEKLLPQPLCYSVARWHCHSIVVMNTSKNLLLMQWTCLLLQVQCWFWFQLYISWECTLNCDHEGSNNWFIVSMVWNVQNLGRLWVLGPEDPLKAIPHILFSIMAAVFSMIDTWWWLWWLQALMFTTH